MCAIDRMPKIPRWIFEMLKEGKTAGLKGSID